MDDDNWEAEFLSTRHVHNRGSRKSTSKKGKQGAFDVKNTFGSYDLKCPSADRLQSTDKPSAITAENTNSKGKKQRKNEKNKRHQGGMWMDIYRLTDDDAGLVGSMSLPGVLEAGIILAATRKGLEERKHKIEERENTKLKENSSKDPDSSLLLEDEENVESQPESESSNEGADSSLERERQRFEHFEKNSFRQPKFWVWWKGTVLHTAADAAEDVDAKGQHHSGIGYVVFSGSSCKRFEGTLSCEELGWNDVAFSGWKVASMKERDVEVM